MRCFFKQTTILLLSSLWLTLGIHAAELSVRVEAPSKAPLQDLVVYLTEIDGAAIKASSENSQQINILQEDKKFLPYVSVMSSVDSLMFENRDNLTHHIYSVLSKDFEQFRLKAGEKKAPTLSKSHPSVFMACNIHDWMAGHLLIVETPYYTKTTNKGVASFKSLKPGTYTVKVWHPQMSDADQVKSHKVTITDSSTLTITLQQPMDEIPLQDPGELFEFSEDY